MPSTSKTYNYTTNSCYNPQSVQYIFPFDFEYDEEEQYDELTEYPFHQNIQYNSYNKATKIKQGDYELEIFYGHDKERRKSILKQGENTVYTRYYLGKYEKEINHITNTSTEYYYVGGPMGNIAVYISENGAAPVLHYTITDHLGSIVAIADEDGDIIEEQRYDPWGVYRCPTTGTPEETPQLAMLFRGYTGHEMLPEFGLINMNGRLYDPALGRMLSPDNYVQSPNFTQSFNRYSYAGNNPMKYVDPDGQWMFIPLAIMSAVIAGNQMGYYSYHKSGDYWSGFWTGAAIGGFSSLAGAGMGLLGNMIGISGIIPGAIWGGSTGMLTGYVTGGLTSYYTTGSFSDGAGKGLISGGISGAIMGGFSGYKSAKAKGRNVWTGGKVIDKWEAGLNYIEMNPETEECLLNTFAANDERFGEGRGVDWIKENFGEYPSGAYDEELRKWGHEYSIAKSRNQALDMLNEYNLGGYAQEYKHSTAINKITKISSGWFGIEYHRIEVMDPKPLKEGGGFNIFPFRPENRYLIITNIY